MEGHFLSIEQVAHALEFRCLQIIQRQPKPIGEAEDPLMLLINKLPPGLERLARQHPLNGAGATTETIRRLVHDGGHAFVLKLERCSQTG